jgi:hypothetical protein
MPVLLFVSLALDKCNSLFGNEEAQVLSIFQQWYCPVRDGGGVYPVCPVIVNGFADVSALNTMPITFMSIIAVNAMLAAFFTIFANIVLPSFVFDVCDTLQENAQQLPYV